MNKRQKPSKSRRGAGITLAVCFVAAAVMVGTYTLRNYQEAKRQEQALAEENADTKEKESQEEAGSSLVINTEEDPADGAAAEETRDSGTQDAAGETAEGQPGVTDTSQGTPSGDTSSYQTSGSAGNVDFNGESILLWPVDGNLIINYSMDKTVYFSTLDQYKYNPALIISGAEGDQVISSTTGIVKSIDESAQTGTTVNIDIGNGYELFYGQLKDVTVSTGDYVEAKTVIGYVAQPTKYYSVEGCNVYFEMRKDGQPVNPMDYMAD